jgi:uncharacterized protein (DUF697 family)/uncharacterized tellurite resistance protein B-like protein
MSITETEALASLRILVAVAHADGTVHSDERRSLAAALEALELPRGLTVDALLAEEVDIDAQLAELSGEEAREQIYRSAYFMAHADGACSSEEQKLLDRIAEVTAVPPETRRSLDRIFVGRAKGGESKVAPITDPAERSAAVDGRIRRYAILSGVLGAFPIPLLAIATDLAVIGLQLKMISDIGAYWGHRVDRANAKSLLYGVGLGTGARLAVNNLAKLLPGWGSVVGGATSFVSTFALGRVMNQYFAASPGDVAATSPEELRKNFKMAEKMAREVYEGQADVIIQSQRTNQETLDALSKDVQAGKITQAELDERVSALL